MVKDPDLPTADGVAALVADGEAALDRGDAAEAFRVLALAARGWALLSGDVVARLAAAYSSAARIVGEQARTVEWIEKVLPDADDAVARAALLRAQLSMWSRLDTARALALEPEALEAAEAIGDEEGVATVLAMASFAAYRRGDLRRCREISDRAAALATSNRAAQYQAVRAQMFAATAAGELEAVLHMNMKGRALARELNRAVDVANESNNLAETYLELGHPHEALACAELAERLCGEVGHTGNQMTAKVLVASAAAEIGDVDGAIARFQVIPVLEQYPIPMLEAAMLHAFWLLERGAAGDAARARERATAGIEFAQRSGTAHRLPALYASLARALTREASHEAAREQFEHARKGADKAEPTAHSYLALAAAEVLAAGDAPRNVILMAARARILRVASRREDPHAFCVHVRHNRRLLELTGGVPADLPGGS
jgi:tetratricopeptide (TPR) repeat protein